MSYILEALKKSDQQRQQGTAPTLMSVQLPAEETRERTFPWLVALAAMVFIAGILIGWLQPWRSEQSAATEQPTSEKTAVQAPQASPPTTAPARLNAPVDIGTTLARNPERVQPPQPLAASPPSSAALLAPSQATQTPASPIMPPAAKNPPPAAVRAPVAAIREPQPAVPAKSVGAAEQNVMTKAELPPAILQELPAMVVSLHAYSAKPSNRLVSINNQLLQEGDSLMSGLTLEEITRKDMIFTYKGFRFRQGMQ